MPQESRSDSVNNDTVLTSETQYKINHEDILKTLKTLPPTEFHYYIALLVGSIENEPNPEKHQLLLATALHLTKTLSELYACTSDEDRLKKQNEILLALNDLVGAAKMNTVSHSIKKALMGICGVVLAIFIGIHAAIGGFAIGLFTDYNVIGNLRGAWLGFAMGLGIGIHVGRKIPNKLFQSEFENKLEFTINSLQRVTEELQNRKTPEQYREETKQYVMKTFFKGTPEEREIAFNEFLQTNQKFQVCSTAAGFIHAKLKGHVGQHSLIRFKIAGLDEMQTMEFNPSEKAPKFLNQLESEREVSGEKFFEMLVLNLILQETHQFSLSFMLSTYDVASNDCLTYDNKLLLGTGQPPTQQKSFNPKVDQWTSTNIVAPIMGFFSSTKGNELQPFLKHYEDNNKPEITCQKWEGKKIAAKEIPNPEANEYETDRPSCSA